MAVNFPTIATKPDTSSTLTYQSRLLFNRFGDGYQSIIPDGINNLVRNYTPVFLHITPAEHGTLLSFVKTHRPLGTIITMPIYPEDSTGNTRANFVIIEEPTFSGDEGGALYNWTIPLQEVFDA